MSNLQQGFRKRDQAILVHCAGILRSLQPYMVSGTREKEANLLLIFNQHSPRYHQQSTKDAPPFKGQEPSSLLHEKGRSWERLHSTCTAVFFPFFFDGYFPRRVSNLLFFSVVKPRALSLLLRPVPFPSFPFFETYRDPVGLTYE